MDLNTIIAVFIIAVLGLIIYKIKLEYSKPQIEKDFPQYRAKAQFITKDGILTAKTITQLSPIKYQVEYDNGYRQTYYRDEHFDEIVPLDKHHNIFGKTAPVYIEFDVLLATAHGYENVPMRKLMMSTLKETEKKLRTSKNVKSDDVQKFLEQAKETLRALDSEPISYTEAKKAYAAKGEEALRLESTLRATQAGEEGRVSQRTDQLVDIASRRASSKDGKSDGSDRG